MLGVHVDMKTEQLNTIVLAPNDDIIAVFCIAIAILAILSTLFLKENPYYKFFALSLSMFFFSTAASVLKSLQPISMQAVEHITLLAAAASLALAAYNYRQTVGDEEC
jgi:hypothetical protein